MKAVITRSLVILGSFVLCAPALGGQIVRSSSGGREIVTLVDHGQTRGRPALQVRGVPRRHLEQHAVAESPPVECAPTEAVTAAAMADGMPSLLAFRLEKGDTTEVPDVGTDPTAYQLRVVGAVADETTRNAVAEQAMRLLGAGSVRNELRLMYEWDGNPYYSYDDPHVQERVERALLAWPGLHNADINVSVAQGITTLTGSVPTQDQREHASAAAYATAGVSLVQNRLNLEPD